jgi:hypothetical protein
MADLLSWAKKKVHDAENTASRVYDQINPLDGGRTFQQRTPTNPQASAVHQATHNAVTNMAGDVGKSLVRSSMAINQGIGNAEIGVAHALGQRKDLKIQNAQQYQRAAFPSLNQKKLNQTVDYNGSPRQIAGDALSNVVNVAFPGSSKLVEGAVAKGAAKVIPGVVKAVAPKVITKMAAYVPKVIGGAVAGAGAGGVGSVGNLIASNEKLTPQNIGNTFVTGAKYGAIAGAASPLIAPAARVVAKGVSDAHIKANTNRAIDAGINNELKTQQAIQAKIQKVPLGPEGGKTTTELMGHMDQSNARIKQLEANRPQMSVVDKALSFNPGLSTVKVASKVISKLPKDQGGYIQVPGKGALKESYHPKLAPARDTFGRIETTKLDELANSPDPEIRAAVAAYRGAKGAGNHPQTVKADELAGKARQDSGLPNLIRSNADEYELRDIPLAKLEYDYNGAGFVDKKASRKTIEKYVKNGVDRPLVVDGRGRVLDGNHRSQAALVRGEKSVKAYVPKGADVNKFDNLHTRLQSIDGNIENHYKQHGGRFYKDSPTPPPTSPLAGEARKGDIPGYKRLYHATDKNFDTFDDKYLGSNTDASNTNTGHFFVDNPKHAQDFINTLKKGFGGDAGRDVSKYKTLERFVPDSEFMHLNTKSGKLNQKQIDDLAEYLGSEDGRPLKGAAAKQRVDEVLGNPYARNEAFNDDPDAFKDFLKSKGYAGIVDDFGQGVDEYVVIDPTKIKKREDISKRDNDYKMYDRPKGGSNVIDIANGADGLVDQAKTKSGTVWEESRGILTKLKGAKPDDLITVYRTSPKGELNEGDWITLSKDYADFMAASKPAGLSKVHEYKVKAKDVQSGGEDITEFGYFPAKDSKPSLLDKVKKNLPSPKNQGGYAKIPFGKNDPAPDLHPTRDIKQQIQNERDFLEQPKLSNGVRRYGERKIAQLERQLQESTKTQKTAPQPTPPKQVAVAAKPERIDSSKGSVAQKVKQVHEQLKALSDSPEFQEFYKGGNISGKSWNEYQRLSREYRQLADSVDKPTAPAAKQPPQSPPKAKPTPVQEKSLVNSTPKMSIPEDAPSRGMRQRGLATTIQNDPNTPQAVKDKVSEVYKIRDTKDLQSRAANLVKDDPALARRVFDSDSNSDVGTMIGSELSAHLSRSGEHEAAAEIAMKLAREATHRGQANQALSTWGKLAPESILRFAQKTVNEYNGKAGLTGGRGELVLSPEQSKDIFKASEDLQKMAPGRQKDIATQRMLKKVQEVIPASWVKKLGATQTIGQLLNPKTLIRNIVGNTLFNPLEAASQTISAGIDKGISKAFGTQRTTALPQFGAQVKGAIRGGKAQIEELNKGVNLGPDTQFDLNNVPVFRNKAMRVAEKGLGYALRVPDRAAFTAAYDDTVQGLMKAQKLDKPTQAILDQAEATGLYRTFQDNSSASQLFTKLKGAFNVLGIKGKDGTRFGLGDLILKYPKTPGNLISRGIDYSPVGIIGGILKAGANAAAGKPFDQHALVNSIGRGVTGTGALIGTGAALGALGIITEKPSTDADTRNLQKESGQGGYQINTSALIRFMKSGFNKDQAKLKEGDKLVSYDWAQPASIPLSVGAALGKKQSPKDAAGNVLTGMSDGLNTLVEQPLVTGVNTFANNIKNKGIAGAGLEALKGAPASFVPTASNQVRQLTDNTTRNTYSNNTGQQVVQSVENKIPGLSKRVPARIGSFGEDLQNYQNGSNNFFNVALNPAFVSKYQPKDAAKLPLDIMNNTGETKQNPLTPKPTQTINGVATKLTPKQNSDFAKYVGSKTGDAFTALSKDPEFLKLPQVDQAKKMSGILSDINAAGKVSVLGDNPKNPSVATKAIIQGNTPSWTDASIAKGINPHSTKILTEYNGLTGDQRKSKAYKENDYDYKVVQAKYDNDKANGKLSRTQLITQQNAVNKAKVGSTYSKDVRDLYALSKGDLSTFLDSDPNGQAYASQLKAYDQALKNAGINKTLKFANGFSPGSGSSLKGLTADNTAGKYMVKGVRSSALVIRRQTATTAKKTTLKKYAVARPKVNLNMLAKRA